MTELSRSNKWDKQEKFPIHCKEFPGTKKAIWNILLILDHFPDKSISIEQWYVNPTHYFVFVISTDKKLKVYVDGNLLDPNQEIND